MPEGSAAQVMTLIPKLFKASKSKLSPGESMKLAFGNDQVYCLLEGSDKPLLVAATLIVGDEYPERIASNMLFECLTIARSYDMDLDVGKRSA